MRVLPGLSSCSPSAGQTPAGPTPLLAHADQADRSQGRPARRIRRATRVRPVRPVLPGLPGELPRALVMPVQPGAELALTLHYPGQLGPQVRDPIMDAGPADLTEHDPLVILPPVQPAAGPQAGLEPGAEAVSARAGGPERPLLGLFLLCLWVCLWVCLWACWRACRRSCRRGTRLSISPPLGREKQLGGRALRREGQASYREGQDTSGSWLTAGQAGYQEQSEGEDKQAQP